MRNLIYQKINCFNCSPISIPDISVWCGKKCTTHPQAITRGRIMAHALDFDLYLKEESLTPSPISDERYAVFIDQNLAVNHDRVISGMEPIVSYDKYFGEMNQFLEYLQDLFGIKVLVAGHPKAGVNHRSDFNFRIIYGSTANLIRNSSFVITHYSAALSLAVLWRKPIIPITTDEINSSKLWNYPFTISRQLGRRTVNVSNFERKSVTSADLSINSLIYDRYKEDYLKIKGTPLVSIWNIFSKAILDRSYLDF